MRPDMGRVIVERGRVGRWKLATRDRVEPDEDSPTRESMRARLDGSAYQGDHLAPLLRFLEKSVGRRWDDVYSEIRAVADHRTVKGNHLIDHANDYVATWTEYATQPKWRWFRFYADPAGILRAGARFRYRRPEPPPEPDVIPVSRSVEIRRIKGVWYEVQLAPVTETTFGQRDVVTGRPVFLWKGAVHVAERLYATSKRQLGKKELRARGLRGGSSTSQG